MNKVKIYLIYVACYRCCCISDFLKLFLILLEKRKKSERLYGNNQANKNKKANKNNTKFELL